MSLIETTDELATPTHNLTEIFYRAVTRPVQGNRIGNQLVMKKVISAFFYQRARSATLVRGSPFTGQDAGRWNKVIF